jgi:uncharacterized protein YqeY
MHTYKHVHDVEINDDSDYLKALQEVKDRYLQTLESYQKLIKDSKRAEDATKLRSLYDREAAELKVLSAFLPAEYSQEELTGLLPDEIKTFSEAIKILRKEKIDFTRISRTSLVRQLRQIYR